MLSFYSSFWIPTEHDFVKDQRISLQVCEESVIGDSTWSGIGDQAMGIQMLFLKGTKRCSLWPWRRQDILQKE